MMWRRCHCYCHCQYNCQWNCQYNCTVSATITLTLTVLITSCLQGTVADGGWAWRHSGGLLHAGSQPRWTRSLWYIPPACWYTAKLLCGAYCWGGWMVVLLVVGWLWWVYALVAVFSSSLVHVVEFAWLILDDGHGLHRTLCIGVALYNIHTTYNM